MTILYDDWYDLILYFDFEWDEVHKRPCHSSMIWDMIWVLWVYKSYEMIWHVRYVTISVGFRQRTACTTCTTVSAYSCATAVVEWVVIYPIQLQFSLVTWVSWTRLLASETCRPVAISPPDQLLCHFQDPLWHGQAIGGLDLQSLLQEVLCSLRNLRAWFHCPKSRLAAHARQNVADGPWSNNMPWAG